MMQRYTFLPTYQTCILHWKEDEPPSLCIRSLPGSRYPIPFNPSAGESSVMCFCYFFTSFIIGSFITNRLYLIFCSSIFWAIEYSLFTIEDSLSVSYSCFLMFDKCLFKALRSKFDLRALWLRFTISILGGHWANNAFALSVCFLNSRFILLSVLHWFGVGDWWKAHNLPTVNNPLYL